MKRKNDEKFTFAGLAHNKQRKCYTYNLYTCIKNNALLRITQSLLSVYIGEGFFLLTELFNISENLEEKSYQIIFVPLGVSIMFSFVFVLIFTREFLKCLNNYTQKNEELTLEVFHKKVLKWVIVTHVGMGVALLCLFYYVSRTEFDCIWSLLVILYSLTVGIIWAYMDYFSDMQILKSRFIAGYKENYNEEYFDRASYFIKYCKMFVISVVIIIIMFTITLAEFDSILLEKIFGESEAGIYVFITTQVSLMIVYFKLAFSRIRSQLNLYFDFCEIRI